MQNHPPNALTIADGVGPTAAGILNSTGVTLTLTNCILTNNDNSLHGAIYNPAGSTLIVSAVNIISSNV